MAIVMGLNSGSSFDGIDVVLVDIGSAEDGYPSRPKFLAGKSFPWPEKIGDRILKSFENNVSVFELCRLNYLAGAVYAECARSLMEEQGLKPGDIEVIGYDGQTVYQEPSAREKLPDYLGCTDLVERWESGAYPCGIQIGEPSIVSVACETPVVTHFRTMDHALGGNGAPLMQFLDFVAFRDIGPAMTLNIGGIANVQIANKDRSKMMAFDTGPGNVMIDHAMKHFFQKAYDENGSTAEIGNIDQNLLSELKQHPYFQRPIPRSAWRLDFGSTFADKIIANYSNLSPANIITTLTEFTAWGIVRSIQDNVPNLSDFKEVIASGGGVFNKNLMERLKENLPSGIELVTSDKYGIPAQFKEAIKFGTLAHANLNKIANNIPAASGAACFAILGKLLLPPRMAQV